MALFGMIAKFHCTAGCGEVAIERYVRMDEMNTQTCSCGAAASRGEPPKRYPGLDFTTPIEMHSIGLNSSEEIADFRRRCPDVHVSSDERDPNWGIPIAANRAQKLRALKAVGFVEAK